jgi:hypothetical protein
VNVTGTRAFLTDYIDSRSNTTKKTVNFFFAVNCLPITLELAYKKLKTAKAAGTNAFQAFSPLPEKSKFSSCFDPNFPTALISCC